MINIIHRRTVVALIAPLWSLVAPAGCSPEPAPAPVRAPAPAPASKVDAASAPDAAAAAGGGSRTQLTAALVDSRHVELTWTRDADDADDARDECAWFVEFGIGAEADFSILTIVPPQTTTFRHADLAQGTAFNYRIRPAVGRASDVVAVTTAALPPGAAPPIEAEGPLTEPFDSLTLAQDRPSATRSSPTSVDLRWRDRTADEDGFLVEVSLHPTRDFVVCALLPPDTTSFRKANLPPTTTCYFRVRAFVHGQPSNVVTTTTASETPATAKPAAEG